MFITEQTSVFIDNLCFGEVGSCFNQYKKDKSGNIKVNWVCINFYNVNINF